MNLVDVQRLTVGDVVARRVSEYGHAVGRVSQATHRWFMVSWADGDPEIIRRSDPRCVLFKKVEIAK